MINLCFTESWNCVVFELKSACAWTLWPSCLFHFGSRSCSASSWWQPWMVDGGTVFFYFKLKSLSGLSTPVQSSLSAATRMQFVGFYFSFFLQVKQKARKDTSSLSAGRWEESIRRERTRGHLRFLSLESRDLFSVTSAHLPALWPVYFYCQVSLLLSVAVSLSVPQWCIINKLVSGLIHTPVVSRYVSPSSSTFPKT